MRLASAVALALFIAFYLELDNPSWAGTSAGIVCQPVLGASLRKGFFRMVGTVVGATATVVLTGLFPQNRVGFLVAMALWTAACSFGNTLTRNFSAYAFALSGYTLAIIAGDSISDPSQAFHLAITRATEIVIGIGCAMAVTGLSELGRSRAKLADLIDAIGREILAHFADLLRDPARHLAGGPDRRRALIARVAALDPVIDQAIGEEPELRQRVAVLRDATAGLFAALSGWRIAESHLVHLPPARRAGRARPVAERLPRVVARLAPTARRRGPTRSSPAPTRTRRRPPAAAGRTRGGARPGRAEAGRRRVASACWPTPPPSSRSASAPPPTASPCCATPPAARDPGPRPGLRGRGLPARGGQRDADLRWPCRPGSLFWILTEWPSGLGAVTFLAVTVLLLAPQQEKSAKAALGFGIGTVLTAVLAAVVDFALLPNHESFLALAGIMACFLVPLAALSTVPALAPYFVAATMNFVPLVGPSNQITFDTLSFYNSALGIVGGCLAGALALVLIPPVPKPMRADRLVDLTLRDLRRLAAGRWSPTPDAWQRRVYARLVAMPEGVDPVHGSRLVAALSTGLQALRILSLAGARRRRRPAARRARALGDARRRRHAGRARRGRRRADRRRGGRPDLRVPTAIQVVRDVVRQHRHEFEGR